MIQMPILFQFSPVRFLLLPRHRTWTLQPQLWRLRWRRRKWGNSLGQWQPKALLIDEWMSNSMGMKAAFTGCCLYDDTFVIIIYIYIYVYYLVYYRHTHVYTYIHIYVHVYMCISGCIYVCLYIYTYTITYIYIYLNIYIYINASIHD